MDVTEFIKKFDDGEGVPSIVMGGLSRGYEFAIQKGAIEVLRSAVDKQYKLEEDDDKQTKFKEICNDKIKEIDKELGGLSGAMFGALQWLSFQWIIHGIDWIIEKAKDDDESRLIEVFSDGRVVGGDIED
jgi:hypothetical protein